METGGFAGDDLAETGGPHRPDIVHDEAGSIDGGYKGEPCSSQPLVEEAPQRAACIQQLRVHLPRGGGGRAEIEA
ncbi:MAG: hypothetical protein UY75_C0008G0008 [Parcubacteria group bacterium GW2011_GWC2_52_8c]|nr:MAG: hypothetical protein UY75_C0008G0008 [Parcubacteria group bacterium GW2011_GWC2_52_8c]